MDPEVAVTMSQGDSDKETQMELSKNQTKTDGSTREIRVDRYGIPLHPSPEDDEMDPLNWPTAQKHLALFTVCLSSLLGVYTQTVSTASVFILMAQFNTSYSKINWTLAAPALTATISPVLLSSMGDIYGRRPVLICCSALTLIATGCTTILSISYGLYMYFRLLQGVGTGVASVVCFGLIQDISFEHERGLRTGLWVLAVDMGFILGAIFGGFTATAKVNWTQYHIIIAYGILLILETFLLPETLYPRKRVQELIARGESLEGLKRTRQIRPWHVKKIPGFNHVHPFQGTIRFFKLFSYPRVVLSILPFMFLQYWWNISAITMEPAAYQNYSTLTQGLLFIGIALGILFGELFCSGQLSDHISSRLALRSNDIRTPEMRLWLAYPGIVVGAVGTIMWGISVAREWHWVVGQVGFFLMAVSLQVVNAAITTYAFDCYPDYPLEILTFYCASANLSAFLAPLFINYWVSSVGFAWCFTTQGLLMLLLIPLYTCLQKWGKKLSKDMNFEDDK